MSEIPLDNKLYKAAGSIAYVFLPSFLYYLFGIGKLDKDRTYNKMELWDIVQSNGDLIENLTQIHLIYYKFIESAKFLSEKGDQYSTLILIVSSIEHIINTYLRESLPYFGLDDGNINNIIRTSNFDSKFGWILKLVSDIELPSDLKRQINDLIQMRNRLIHYKSIPTRIDEPKPLSDIDSKIKDMDFNVYLEIISQLQEFLDHSLILKDPLRLQVKKMTNLMFDFPSDMIIKNNEDFIRALESR